MAGKVVTNSFRSSGGSVIECSYRQIVEKAGSGKNAQRIKKRRNTIQRSVDQRMLKKD